MSARLQLRSALLMICLAFSILSISAQEPVRFDSETFAGLGARAIGPAVMSGRIAAMDAAIEKGRLTLYVGAAGGGVWKSVNGGTTFKPVFDKHTQSIGAIAIDPGNPKTVWVGTGESWTRNSVSIGDGIYKTTDGGETWQKMGLPDSERIARIIVDPKDSSTVYVAATGHLWDANDERGLYKTTDGGKTWKKSLFVNADTGCAMMAMDPQDTKIIYAAMWQFRRKGWTFNSGGPGSGLYKSTDGGETWKKLSSGLPAGDLGRIGIAVAPSRPSTVYAVVEAKESGLYRSDDFGESWRLVNTSAQITGRPFYFANLSVDPQDYNRVYKLATALVVSNDGGKTFSGIGGTTHSDHHALWINPANPEQIFTGNDGGLYTSEDRGNTWRFIANLPLSQFYHVSYDMDYPYNVYGGLQDNSTWVGPSRGASGVYSRDWRSVYGGDGFWAFQDATDPDYVYAEYQGGSLARINKKTLETKNIQPLPNAGEELRFNWNSPIHLSATNKGTVYFGAQFLFRSKDRGDTWSRISPDLTTNDPEKQKQELSGGLTVDNSSAENHTTIFTISESPKNPQIIWVGTDDGNVQITRNDGKKWENVAGNISGLPKNAWVSSIEASRFDEAAAYVTFDNHTTGEMKTWVYKTTDYGKTWTSLVTPDLSGYAHIIREDLVSKDLLFLGTELGLFISLDGGKQWAKFTGGNFPNVAVRDLQVHSREHDLILATHGRGIWIVDDISPLRALTPEVLAKDATFVPGRNQAMTIPVNEFGFNGDAEFYGPNPGTDASITYYQKKRHIIGDLKFEIYDPAGQLLATVPGNKRRGLNRVEWTMRSRPPKVPPAADLVPNFYALVGPRVLPGTYTVKMIKDKQTLSTDLILVADPRSRHTAEDRKVQYDTVLKLYEMLGELTFTVDRMLDLRDQAKARSAQLSTAPDSKSIDEFVKKLEAIRAKIVATREGSGIIDEKRIREKLGALYGSVNGFEGRPTQSQITYISELSKELGTVVAEFDALTKKEMPAVNGTLQKKSAEPLRLMTKDEWQKKQEKN
jgi:photosystem II stability/assembly factor-like uncharacterized protein